MNHPTPILIIDNSFTFGGAINSLKNMITALDKGKFGPIIVSGQPKEYLSRNFDNIKCYKVNPKLPWIHNSMYKRIATFPFFRNRLAMKILNISRFLLWFVFLTLPEAIIYYKIGKRHRVGLVHLNNMFGSQIAGIIAAKLLRVPCVAHLRDFEAPNLLNRFFVKFIQHHIAISTAIRDNLLDLDVPRDKISVVFDGIDLGEFNDTKDCDYVRKEFGLKEGQKTFGVFGRIMYWKGIKEFVRSANRVCKVIPEAKAFVVGNPSDGDQKYFDEALELVSELKLNDKVVFTGFRKDIPSLMKSMDVIVHSSITPEPFGMVIIEGMAMRKPVVAMKAGGPLDIVQHNETGFLVTQGNIKEMAEKIIELLENEPIARRMGEKGRDRVFQIFCNERYARQIEDVYGRMLNERLPTLLERVKACIPKTLKRRVRLIVRNCIDSMRYYGKFERCSSRKISGVIHILFACKGNICRSAYAEYRLKQKKDGKAMAIDSGGLDVDQGGNSPAIAVCAAWQQGVNLSKHVSKSISECDLERADVIFVMEYGQLERLRKVYPHKRNDIELLRQYAPLPYRLFINIDDPFGWGMDQFKACFALIDKSLDGFLKSLE